jgi:hypothetical protein
VYRQRPCFRALNIIDVLRRLIYIDLSPSQGLGDGLIMNPRQVSLQLLVTGLPVSSSFCSNDSYNYARSTMSGVQLRK